MHVGCCTSCLTPFMPLSEAVRCIAEAGFTAIEFNMSGTGAYAGEWPAAQRDEIFTCIDRHRLSVNLHININDLCRRSKDEHRDYDALVEQCLGVLPQWAARIPLRCITFDAAFHRPYRTGRGVSDTAELSCMPPGIRAGRMLLMWLRQAARQAVTPVIPSVLRNLIKTMLHPINIDDTAAMLNAFPALERSGVVLGIENYLSGMCRPEDFTRLRAVAPGPWGILLDTGHAHIASCSRLVESASVAAYIHALPAQIVDVHINDNDGTVDAHRKPGTGTIDMASVIEALRKKSYDGGLMLEFTAVSAQETIHELSVTKTMMERMIGVDYFANR